MVVNLRALMTAQHRQAARARAAVCARVAGRAPVNSDVQTSQLTLYTTDGVIGNAEVMKLAAIPSADVMLTPSQEAPAPATTLPAPLPLQVLQVPGASQTLKDTLRRQKSGGSAATACSKTAKVAITRPSIIAGPRL